MINYKVVIGFVSGALFGGALGAYLMKDKYEKESRLAIDEVKAYYREKYDIDIPYKKEEESAEEVKEETTDPRPAPGEALRQEYHFDDKGEFTESEIIEQKDAKDEESAPATKVIYPISDYDFFDGNPHYGKERLYFYMKDDILVNEDLEEVEDYSVVGDDISTRFTRQMGIYYEDEPVYIRNDAIGVDYEITPRNASFYSSNEGTDTY